MFEQKGPYTLYKSRRSPLKKWMGKEDDSWEGRPYFHRQSVILWMGTLQAGPLLVINGVITPINGIIHG